MTSLRRSTSVLLAFCCCYGAEAAYGVLKVASEPSGATVSLDGKRIGRAPCKMAVATGEYTVTASARRYDSDSRVVEVKDGEETSVCLTLLPTPIDIKVNCDVKDAAVYVDGTRVGLVNETVKARPGLRELAVVKDGYKDYVRRVQVPWKTPGRKPKTYSVKLKPGTSFRSGVVPLRAENWKRTTGWRFEKTRMIYDSGDKAEATLFVHRSGAFAMMCRYRAANVSEMRSGTWFTGQDGPQRFKLDGKWHVNLLRVDGRIGTCTIDGKPPRGIGYYPKVTVAEENPIRLSANSGVPGNNDPFRLEISLLVIRQFDSVAEMEAAVRP